MAVYVVGARLKALIGWDLIHGLGISIQGTPELGNPASEVTAQTPMPGPYPTSFQHQVLRSQGGCSPDSTPVPGTVMRVMLKKTPSEPLPVAEPQLEQNTCRLRTEQVHGKVHTDLTGAHSCTAKKCSRPQWHRSVKPLFRVGSLVLAQRSRKDTGRLPDTEPMTVKWALGRYDFILSDGNRWSARQLVQCRRSTSEAKNAAGH